MNMDLRMPLIYEKIEKLPDLIPENEEFILCYELNPAQTHSIEPLKEQFLGDLTFSGIKSKSQSIISQLMTVYLPAGHYLFIQQRDSKALNEDEWLDLAIEQHKDGLWERNKLDNLLYIRFLHEDSMFVTQIFRPVINNPALKGRGMLFS